MAYALKSGAPEVGTGLVAHDLFSYTVSDGHGGFDTAHLDIVVHARRIRVRSKTANDHGLPRQLTLLEKVASHLDERTRLPRGPAGAEAAPNRMASMICR